MMKKGYFEETDKREIPISDGTGKPLLLKTEGSATVKSRTKKEKARFKIGKVVWGQQSNAPEKIILIEEILWKDGRKELRFGYRTQTHENRPRWWWGQYALMAPIKDIQEMLQFAREKELL